MYKYKCTECGQEYNSKPDYCDCGNDAFDMIETETTYGSNYAAPQYNRQQTNTNAKKIESYAIAIFVLCIILSIVVLFIPVKTSPNKTKETVKKQQNKISIPSIDEIWNNSTTRPIKKQAQEIVQQPEQKPVQTNIFSSIKNNQTVKTVQPKAVQPKPVQPAKSQTKSKSKAQPQTKATHKPAAATQPQKQTTQQKPIDTAAQKQALLNYKIALRNKIVSNINFGAIVGDGDCLITFKIAQSGKLINRAFAKQSVNDSLNDAVYNGIMLTPAYNPPPSGYKNETLRLTVKMYGGNFEVDLN